MVPKERKKEKNVEKTSKQGGIFEIILKFIY